MSLNYFYKVLFVTLLVTVIECRNYNTGLIFYDLKSFRAYLPPTVSVLRGRAINNVQFSSKGSIWSTFGKPCECQGLLCGCCAGLKVKQFDFDQKMCANITYTPQRKQLLLEVFFNEKPAPRFSLSARNPSPLCVPIMMPIPMAMCVQMSNIAIEGNNLNMCMDFVVRLASADLFEMHFQCMRMGLDGLQYVDKDGKPVLPMNGLTKTANNYEEYYDDTAVNILPIQQTDNELNVNDNDNEIEIDSDSDTDNDSESDNDNDNDTDSNSDSDTDEEEVTVMPVGESETIFVSKETNEIPKPITSSIILEYTNEPTTTTMDADNEYIYEDEVVTEADESQLAVIDAVTKLVTELSALETTSPLIPVQTAQTATSTTSDYNQQQPENVPQNVELLNIVTMTTVKPNDQQSSTESFAPVEQLPKVIETNSSIVVANSTADIKMKARRLKHHTNTKPSTKTYYSNIVPSMNPITFYKRLLGFI